MRNYLIKLISAVILLGIVCVTMSSCGKKQNFSKDSLNEVQNTLEHKYSFDKNNASETVVIDYDLMNRFVADIKNTYVDYSYAEMFNYDKAMSGIAIDHTVSDHRFSALDSSGNLTGEHLLETVNRNTRDYLKDSTSGIVAEIDNQSFLLRICEIITDVTNNLLKQYPDIDKNRVYCNLGNLKIVEKNPHLIQLLRLLKRPMAILLISLGAKHFM